MKLALSVFTVAACFLVADSVSACTTGVTSFTLIDATTDTEIAPLEGFDFSTLDLSSALLNVRANVNECPGEKIDSVRFFFDGQQGLCEQYTPYSWVGDENPNGPDLGDFGAFYGTTISPGFHVLTAIPYPLPDCQGEPHDPKEEEFCTECPGRITGFTLIDSTTDTEIGPLNADFDFTTVQGLPINVRADFLECAEGGIDSVQFFLDGVEMRCEDYTPYALFGDENPGGPDLGAIGPFYDGFISPGVHTILAIPYSGPHCTGKPGCEHEVNFSPVPTRQPSPAPTRLPVSAPTRVPSPAPTRVPSPAPTRLPSPAPTSLSPAPTSLPSTAPASLPSSLPSPAPTSCPDCPGKITGFTLIDAKADKEIMPLDDFNIAQFSTQMLNIRADFEECSTLGIESVQFILDGVNFRCEDYTPYSLAGDENPNGPDLGALGKFYTMPVTVGSHTVVAVPFSAKRCTGNPGCSLSQTFEIAFDGCPGAVTGLSLYKVDTNTDIGPITHGAVFCASQLPSRVAIRAITQSCNGGDGIDRVNFEGAFTGNDSRSPYFYPADPTPVFGLIFRNRGIRLGAAVYEVSATPYSAAGVEGLAMSATFVVNAC